MSVAFCCCSLFNISFLPDARPNLKIQSIGILATCFGFCISLQLNFWAIVTFSFWLFHTQKTHTYTPFWADKQKKKVCAKKICYNIFNVYVLEYRVCVFVFFVLFSVPLFSVCFFLCFVFIFVFVFTAAFFSSMYILYFLMDERHAILFGKFTCNFMGWVSLVLALLSFISSHYCYALFTDSLMNSLYVLV